MRHSFRRINRYSQLAVSSIVNAILRHVTQAVLMTKLQRNSGDAVFQIDFVRGEKGASAGHSRDLFQNGLAAHLFCAAAKQIGYSQGVNLNVSLFDNLAKLAVGIAAVVVHTVADDNQSFARVATLPDLFDRDIGGIVKSGAAL